MAEESKKTEEAAPQDARKLSDEALDEVNGGLNIPRAILDFLGRKPQTETLAYRAPEPQLPPQSSTLVYRSNTSQPQPTTLVNRSGKGRGSGGPVSL